jgi:hypothetical protein
MPRGPRPNKIVEQQLDVLVRRLEKALGADVLSFSGPILYGADDAIRDTVEGRRGKRERLAVVLETTGGYVEVVEFIVPNFAMSAGTVLVMSGDAIHMDYYSVLGPIDPQVERESPNGKRQVPALGYLAKYDELVRKSAEGRLTEAELAFMLDSFDLAELHAFEQARDLSISLLQEWLAKYKFKTWTRTQSRGIDVTPEMRAERAKRIAQELSKTEKWHSHARGISMAVLQGDPGLGLVIDDFGGKPELRRIIREYDKVRSEYRGVLGLSGNAAVLHIPGTYLVLGR